MLAAAEMLVAAFQAQPAPSPQTETQPEQRCSSSAVAAAAAAVADEEAAAADESDLSEEEDLTSDEDETHESVGDPNETAQQRMQREENEQELHERSRELDIHARLRMARGRPVRKGQSRCTCLLRSTHAPLVAHLCAAAVVCASVRQAGSFPAE